MSTELFDRRTSGAKNRNPDLRSERQRIHLILGVIVVGAAILRFGTLGLQSFWSDEAATVDLVRMSLGHMLSAIPDSERTPPVYYVLAWFWTRLFGSGEVGLRSLSALFGTLTVPIAFLLAKRVAGELAGLIAAALTAVSPILVWYSQEARSYELLVFLTAASVWLSLRARETRSPRWIVGWGVVACLAIATHYFASFVVVFEVLLIAGAGVRGRVLWAVLALLGAVQLALAPLAAYQARAHEAGDYITGTSLSTRIVDIPKRFLLGEPGAPTGTAGMFAVVLFVLFAMTGWLFLKRVPVDVRRRALALLALAVLATILPLALAFVGLDFFAYRNLLAIWVLLAVVAAAALSTPHSYASVIAAGGLILTFLALTIAFNVSPSLQRADWKFSPQALGRPRWARLIVLTPYFVLRGISVSDLRSVRAVHERSYGRRTRSGSRRFSHTAERQAPPPGSRFRPPPGNQPPKALVRALRRIPTSACESHTRPRHRRGESGVPHTRNTRATPSVSSPAKPALCERRRG